MQEEYSRTWKLVTITGNYASSREDYKACDCCGKGNMAKKPLIQCKVYHRFIQDEKMAWVCLHCLKAALKASDDDCLFHKKAHRAWHNERVLQHLLTPLRGELSEHIEQVSYLRTFMKYINDREPIPPHILLKTSHYVKENT